MKKMNSILYVVTEEVIDKQALIRAVDLAKKNRAHIHFLKVYESYGEISKLINTDIDRVMELFLDNLQKSLENYSDDLQGVEYSCDIREGIWFIEVIKGAIDYRSDLIVLCDSLKSDATFESDVMHILRKSPIPVWLIRSNTSSDYKRILVAVAMDVNNESKTNVIEKCMSLAEKLEQSCDQQSELVVAHCWSLRNEWYLYNIASNISALHVSEKVERERVLHEEWFESFCKKYSHINISKTFFVKGEPQEIIPQLVRNEKVDTLVMGTLSAMQAKGLYITSRAEAILAGVSCSVLTVKPDDFISPVT